MFKKNNIEIYFKFIRYINIADIVAIFCIYFALNSFVINKAQSTKEYMILMSIALFITMLNTLYQIKKTQNKRKFDFVITATVTKAVAYLIFIALFFGVKNIQNIHFENILAFLLWFSLAYCFLNGYGFLLEDKKNTKE